MSKALKPVSNPLWRGANRRYMMAAIAVVVVMVVAAICSLYRASHEGLNVFLLSPKSAVPSHTAPATGPAPTFKQPLQHP